MIDFTNCPKRHKGYGGANGNKISIIYNDELYMLKFPSYAKLNKDMSYANGCISEYIACHIYNAIGIPAQQTLLGIYQNDNKDKVVVACKDFTRSGIDLQDFAHLKNQIIDSENNGYGTELSDIEQTFEQQDAIDADLLKTRFWDMFIIDALIGNWDRHNGNWGFFYDHKTDQLELSPVYDCGSSLFPQADIKLMQKIMSDQGELNHRIYNIPTSAICIDGKRINYFDYISSLNNEQCNEALQRILPKIDMGVINSIIDSTPLINNIQKDFYKIILQQRKEKILDFSYKKLINKQQSNMQTEELDLDL